MYFRDDIVRQDGWLKEVNGEWILRFRYDWESWDQNPKVWVERGRLQPNGIPLLKNRRKMRRGLAIKLWRELLATNWRRVESQWE